MEIMLGLDPEFVVRSGRRVVLAHEVGIEPKSEGATHFRDGANLEINANASKCRETLVYNFHLAVHKAQAALPAGHTLDTKAAYRVTRKAIALAPVDAKEFGCYPSLDAYTGQQKVVDLNGDIHTKRYAGGHMHFSTGAISPADFKKKYGEAMAPATKNAWDALVSPEGQRKFVKFCDQFIGGPLTFLFDDKRQFERRKYYGQAGEYRSQTYAAEYAGVEYRTPPPQLFNHPALISLFFGVGRTIAQTFDEQCKAWDESRESALRQAINTGEGIRHFLMDMPGWYTVKQLVALKKRDEIHTFHRPNVLREPGFQLKGWEHYRALWNI